MRLVTTMDKVLANTEGSRERKPPQANNTSDAKEINRGLRGLGLTIVLPAYDEGSNVEQTIYRLGSVAERLALDYEIIVVDDGSRDGTGNAMRQLAAKNARIRIFQHEANLGYGAALRTGFVNASKEFVFFTDADLQFDFEEVPKLLALREHADIVIGIRARRSDGVMRNLMGRLWNTTITMLFGYLAQDVDCAFKLLRTEFIRGLKLSSRGAAINAELLLNARLSGHTVAEVIVSHLPRKNGRNKGANPSAVARALREIVYLWCTCRGLSVVRTGIEGGLE